MVAELANLLNGGVEPQRYTSHWLSGRIDWTPFCEAVSGAQPLRVAMWSPVNQGEITALVANRSDGLAHTLSVYARTYPRTIFRASIRDSKADPYPGCAFAYYAEMGGARREVAAVAEPDGWKFVQTGQPQSFEELDRYKQPRIRDRVTRELVTSYLAKLGLNVAEDQFWQASDEYARIEQVESRRAR